MASDPAENAALISLHPRHAESILSGRKKAEFRKVPLRRQIETAAIYATAPVSAIVGVMRVHSVDQSPTDELWQKYREVAGISHEEFSDYYAGHASGVALLVGATVRLASPVPLSQLGTLHPPQSFQYVEAWKVDALIANAFASAPSHDVVRPNRSKANLAGRSALRLGRAAWQPLRRAASHLLP